MSDLLESADDFVSRFKIEQAGCEDLARQVWVQCKDVEPYLIGWSPTLDQLDELLNLLALDGRASTEDHPSARYGRAIGILSPNAPSIIANRGCYADF